MIRNLPPVVLDEHLVVEILMVSLELRRGPLHEVIDLRMWRIKDAPTRYVADEIAIEAVRPVMRTILNVEQTDDPQCIPGNVDAEERREGQLDITSQGIEIDINDVGVMLRQIDVTLAQEIGTRLMHGHC